MKTGMLQQVQKGKQLVPQLPGTAKLLAPHLFLSWIAAKTTLEIKQDFLNIALHNPVIAP